MLDSSMEQGEVRGGVTPWTHGFKRLFGGSIRNDLRCEVLIVGAGITGSLAAHHLARHGHDVVVIDRERPGYGSTAASTAMLLWEIDRSLNDLVKLYGFDRACTIYRRSVAATRGIIALAEKFPCDLRRREALYVSSSEVDKRDLLQEYALRMRAGLPGRIVDRTSLCEQFGVARDAALLSPMVADVDPLRLAKGLLQSAIEQGARLFDAAAVNFDSASRSVGAQLEDGRCIEARHIVLATGYIMPEIVHSDLHRMRSSFAIATAPAQSSKICRSGVLIWEAAENYLYARTTPSGGIIVGGEDDDQAVAPDERDSAMPAKAAAIRRRFSELYQDVQPETELMWSGAFGTTEDGLPLIGPVPGHPNIHAAFGYGGNGITFSYLAAEILGDLIAGEYRSWFEDFAVNRDRPKHTLWSPA